MTRPILSLSALQKTFTDDRGKPLHVLERIHLQVHEGEFLVVLGPSGCGKSTLLRIMSGLEKEYGGNVALGEGLSRRDMGFVFQQFALLPWLTVFENVDMPLRARGIPSADRRKRVSAMLQRMGLEKFSASFPRELSGGMRQRVGIARALVTDPKVLFMDEPFSELDSFIASELRAELAELWNERKLTIILVTHIIAEAAELGSRIAVMTPRPGKIEKIVDNVLPRPRAQRSQEFFQLEDHLSLLVKP